MSNQTVLMNESLCTYWRETMLREPAWSIEFREQTSALVGAHMMIAPEQGNIMAMLLGLMGARRVLELGTFCGYSAAWIASALGEQGELVTCDIDDRHTGVAQALWERVGVADRVSFRVCDAVDLLAELASEGGLFDAVFIDANKQGYDDYYERTLALTRPGGAVLIDNVFRGGDVAQASCDNKATLAIRALNHKLHADARVDLCALPVGDGLTIARKR